MLTPQTMLGRCVPLWLPAFLLVGGCDSVQPAVPDEVRLYGAPGALRIGAEVQMSASVFSQGALLSYDKFTWTTSNPTAVAVIGPGRLRAVGRGSSTVTATAFDMNVGGTSIVSVIGVQSLTVQPLSTPLEVGETRQITISVIADPGVSPSSVRWASNDPSIATVNSSGVVSAIRPGTVSISAECEGVSSTVTVAVIPATVASVRLNQTDLALLEGERVALVATALDRRGVLVPGKAVSWSSSNLSVATVSSSGEVLAVATGQTTILALVDGVTARANVNVNRRGVATVNIQSAGNFLNVGGSMAVSATARDLSGFLLLGRSITWSTSNPSVATISNSGMINAVAMGTTAITASIEGVTNSLTLYVGVPTGGWLSGLSSSSGDALFDLNILPGLSDLVVRTSGGTGSMDLTLFDPSGRQACNAYSFANTNTVCLIFRPVSGRWRARLGYTFVGVTIEVAPQTPTMAIGQSLTGLSSGNGSPVASILVPAGTSSLSVRTFSGSGSVDQSLYTPSGSRACNSYSFSTTSSTCFIPQPQPGYWRVVLGYSFSGLTLLVSN